MENLCGRVRVFLWQTMFGLVGVLLRLPRRILLGLVLFVFGLVLLELVHPSPQTGASHRAAVAQVSATPGRRASHPAP
jgi:hypothetical protein